MSILDDLQAIDTTLNVGIAPKQNFFEFKTEIYEQDCPDANLYILRGMVAVQFSANRAQFDRAYEHAKKHLLHELFKDVFTVLPELRNRIMSGDTYGAMKVIDNLEKYLRGNS